MTLDPQATSGALQTAIEVTPDCVGFKRGKREKKGKKGNNKIKSNNDRNGCNDWCRDMPSYSLTMRKQGEIEAVDKPPPWKIQEGPPLRSHLPLVTVENVSFAYPLVQGASKGTFAQMPHPRVRGRPVKCGAQPLK